MKGDNSMAKHVWKKAVTVVLTGAVTVGSAFSPNMPVFAANSAKTIEELKTDGLSNPLGIDSEKPTFSWQMKSDTVGAAQSAYQIVVQDMSGNVMWDSGKVESKTSTYIEYAGKELAAKTQYQWYVKVTDEKGETYTSEKNTFETALMSTEYDAWGGAEWIGSEELNFDAATASYFDLDMTLQIPEGSSKASVIFGAGDFRLANKAMNIWGSNTENSYVKYEIDISTPSEPKLNIYVVGMPIKGQDKENDAKEADVTVAIPAEALAEDSVHKDIKVNVQSTINSVTCNINDVEVDRNRALNPLGSGTNYNSFPNVDSIGFSVPEGGMATYKDIVLNYPGENGGDIKYYFSENVGATYDIFNGLEGVTVKQDGEKKIIEVDGSSKEVLAYADPSYGSAPMVRGEFSTEQGKQIEKARLYTTAQGVYEMYINGESVADDWFNPGNAEYQSTMPYNTYDVTDMLKEGENAMGAQLAEGWWSGYQSYTAGCYSFYGAKQALMARLDIQYADGTTQTIVTNDDDGNWTSSIEGPVEAGSFYQGERYNAQTEKEYDGWSTADYNDGAWDKVTTIQPNYDTFDFVTRYDEPAKVVKELTAQECLGESQEGSGSYIYDMGENVIGIPQITIPEGYCEDGDEITIRYAEILYPDLEEYREAGLVGTMMVENIRAAMATDFYTATSGAQVIEPHFTFHGYRYIEITGLKKALPAENIKTEVLSSVEMTSTYDSSNELVNRLFLNVQNSQTSNFLSLPTDCPQRNERMGWAGDAQVFSKAASYNADVYNFYRNWLVAYRNCQRKDGSLPVFAPTFQNDKEQAPSRGFSGISWEGALTIIPYNMYIQTGNTAIITDNIDAIDRYLDYLANNPLSEEYKNLTSKTGILADWLSIDSTDSSLINNAVYVYLIGITRDMAKAIGRDDLVTKYEQKYTLSKEEWNSNYFDAETGLPKGSTGEASVANNTEAAYATPLRYGVFSDELIDKAVKNYVQTVKDANYTITSGFSGTPNLVPVLSENGYVEEAYKLFEQTDYASWLYPVTQGATSIWERWNSYTLEGGFNGNNSMNSFNHFSLGAISEWMMSDQLGITTATGKAGYQNFVLQPTIGGTFTYAKGSYDSDYGTIYSGWTAKDGKITGYEATVPANTTATLYLPVTEKQAACLATAEGAAYVGMESHNGQTCAKYELVAGSYKFAITDELSASVIAAEKAQAAAEAAKKEAEAKAAEAEAAKKAAEEAKAQAGANSQAAKEAQKKAEAAAKAAKEAQIKAELAEARATFGLKKVTVSSASSKKAKEMTATWKKVGGADGYQIQYGTSAKDAKKVTVKGKTNTSVTLKKLTAGKTYFVRVRAYKVVNGQKVYTSYSAKKSVVIKKAKAFTANKVTLSSISSKSSKQFKLSWTKVKDASGYEITYSRDKSFKNSTKVAIKKGSTVSTTIKKLKCGKKYYVKVRAYKVVNGKKQYTSYSTVKSITVK